MHLACCCNVSERLIWCSEISGFSDLVRLPVFLGGLVLCCGWGGIDVLG